MPALWKKGLDNYMNITIIGLGLIGGSIGLALKHQANDAIHITGFDRNIDVLQMAAERGAVDDYTDDYCQAVKAADVIFLCTPVLQIVATVKSILPFVKPGVILTDVGSTKRFVFEQLAAILPPDVCYVGGHPMAGSEKSGICAASKELFQNKWYILIPETTQSPAAVSTITNLIGCTGALITTMDVNKHDECAAVISHVPHVAAAALVNLLGLSPENLESNLKLAGGGFRDTTRIASSDSDMWADICLTNTEAMVDSLRNFTSSIDDLIAKMQEGDRQAVYDFFHSAKVQRDTLINASLAPNLR